ncbi:acidic proline-rich protein PRP33-like [Phoca vitulina]|uniref:acidic proline-rich protein PRP33-like n=1 Tax=Phoca vitulina TaxID=9720 RepID=UPI00139656E8|nr:acidic proline-rich protein PRP33-like [Phoca vitulina]
MMRRGTLPEGSMRQEPMPGRPETQNRVRRGLWSDAETGGSPMGNRGTEPPRDPGMSKNPVDARGPAPVPGPLGPPYPTDPPSSPSWGPGAHLPPPTQWSLRPYPAPEPTAQGGMI